MVEMVEFQARNDWIQCFDDNYQTWYYYNTITGVSQWEDPYESSERDICESASSPAGVDNGWHSHPESVEHAEQQAERNYYYSDMSESDNEDVAGQSITDVLHNIPAAASERVIYPILGTRKLHQDIHQNQVLNQDYVHLATVYKMQRPYMDSHAILVCVLCHVERCEDVFFPCEHRCVCKNCLLFEGFREDQGGGEAEDGNSCPVCPLCASVIKRIIPAQQGSEKEIYWKWATEISPSLPKGFLRDFRHSAGVIEAVHVQSKGKSKSRRHQHRQRQEDTGEQQCVLS